MAYKFHSEDSGFCRFYYRNEKRQLFCYQDDGSWGRSDWKFYVCSSDGEPSYECKPAAPVPQPEGESNLARSLRAFLAWKGPTKVRATFSGRKAGAIGGFYGCNVEYIATAPTDHAEAIKQAHAAGFEVHHVIRVEAV